MSNYRFMANVRITRLAPSPTGALHLGNARTFLVNWLLARQNGWRIVLRIEDIDGPRIKPGADRQAIDDLRWLGIEWDDGPIYQTQRLPLYAAVLAQLRRSGFAYPCTCTRKEIELAASAPHAEDGAVVYPGTCRERRQAGQETAANRPACIRFIAPDQDITFIDQFRGPVTINPARELGDFVIAKADGTPAYQLAVVVDDAEAGVTEVVRGDDLIDSTPRQIALYEAFQAPSPGPYGASQGGALRPGEGTPPIAQVTPQDVQRSTLSPTLSLQERGSRINYYHLPLIVGQDGKRLAKRHGDTRLAYYREKGVPRERILALLARWCGIDAGNAITLKELTDVFSIQQMPRERIIFTPADDAWLLSR